MERLDKSERATLRELSEQAKNVFGEGAEYTYQNKDGDFFTLTLEEALEVCGPHIASVPIDVALEMLNKMRQRTLKIEELAENNPVAKERYTVTKVRGQQLVARIALLREG